jgi:hypothetical protein
MEKIFSFSLYGNDSIYNLGAINNAIKIREIFGEDWIIRFYVRNVNSMILDKLIELGCQVIDMNDSNIKDGKFFRFLAIKKDNIVFLRDCDSVVSYREKMMMTDFLNSNKKLHIIRDHPNHKEHIMAGLFGSNCSGISNIEEIINNSNLKDLNQYNVDQFFLSKFIYPKYKNNMLIHDSFNHYYRELDEIILKYPKQITHLGQRMYDDMTEDVKRLKEFEGYIIFNKNQFDSVYELIEHFLNYLSISRVMKRKLVFKEYFVKDKLFLLDDFFDMKELFRYTFIQREKDPEIKEEYYIPNIEGVIKLSELKDVDELKDKQVLGVGTETLIYNDCPYDEFTLYNVMQLNNDIMYRIDEYILRKNLDKYDTVVAHSDINITDKSISKNIILYNDIFNDFSDDTNVNELIRLFSGIFRIHIKPNKIVQHFSKRYWHPWDEDFTVL